MPNSARRLLEWLRPGGEGLALPPQHRVLLEARLYVELPRHLQRLIHEVLKSCNPNLESINLSFVPLLTALSAEVRMGKAVIPEPDQKHWQSRWHSSASEFPDGCSGLTYEAHGPDASGTRRAVSLQLHHPEESK